MDSRPFLHNELTGSTSTFHYDDTTDSFTIEEVSDVEPLIDANREERNASVKDEFGGDMRRVASIPMQLYMQLVADGTARDPKRFKAWLNDRENRFFRTHPGTV